MGDVRESPGAPPRRRLPLAVAALPGAACLTAAPAPPPASPSPPPPISRGFEDRTAAAGLDRPHKNRQFKNPYAEIMAGYTALGAAAAVADYDGDGYEDL